MIHRDFSLNMAFDPLSASTRRKQTSLLTFCGGSMFVSSFDLKIRLDGLPIEGELPDWALSVTLGLIVLYLTYAYFSQLADDLASARDLVPRQSEIDEQKELLKQITLIFEALEKIEPNKESIEDFIDYNLSYLQEIFLNNRITYTQSKLFRARGKIEFTGEGRRDRAVEIVEHHPQELSDFLNSCRKAMIARISATRSSGRSRHERIINIYIPILMVFLVVSSWFELLGWIAGGLIGAFMGPISVGIY